MVRGTHCVGQNPLVEGLTWAGVHVCPHGDGVPPGPPSLPGFSSGGGRLRHTGGALPKELGISPGARKSSQCTNRLEDNFVFPNSELIKISLGTCLQTIRNNKRIHHLEFYL